MGRLLCACLALFVWGCNGEPKNTCVPYAHSVVSAGTAPTNCNGLCMSLATSADAAASDTCVVDCTDGGNSVCSSETVCAPFSSGRSYCTLPCTGDGGGFACPSQLTCDLDAGGCSL